MATRLVILLATAVGLAIYVATRSAPPARMADVDDEPWPNDEKKATVRLKQTPLCERPLPGEDVEASPTITVEVDPSGKKNRLYYYVSEPNGYYVESFRIRFYYKDRPTDTPEDSDKVDWVEIVDKYVPAKGTLKGCVEVVPAELRSVGGHMGKTANWGAEIVHWCRARAQNPEPLPPLADAGTCD